jgi:hypothetical protein
VPSPARSRLLAGAIALAVLAAACTSSAPSGSGSPACPAAPAPPDDLEGWGIPSTAQELAPLIISGQTCGPNRVLFTIVDGSGRPVAAPDRTASIAVYDLGRDPAKPIATADGTFVWAIENERGIYVAHLTFPESGRYGAEFTTAAGSGPPQTIRLTFDVQPSSPAVKVGDRAPASKTPTLADVGGDPTHVSTDQHPLPTLYEISVDQALAAHEPFVLIFATPKFCTSAQCGPTLDRIKPFVSRYPSVTFINVEPYKLKLVDGTLEPDVDANNQLQAAPTTDEWHLLTEPTVYVVDRDGIVTANFELIFSDAELTAALDAVK